MTKAADKQQLSEEQDDWTTSSGLPDNFAGTIIGASFGYRAEYANGEIPLFLPVIDGPDLDDPIEQGFSIGKGWNVVNGGKSVEHGKKERFTKSSLMGKLVTRIVTDLKVPMQGRGKSRDAATWVGLNCFWKREKIEYGEDIGNTDHIMPFEFLGFENAGGGNANNAVVETKSVLNAPNDVMEMLKATTSVMDKLAWQKWAVTLDGVKTDTGLLTRALAGLYEELKG